ncbi:MAG: lysophospholipid acyltransferase family protein, partial [Candidatus Binatia bacterium]
TSTVEDIGCSPELIRDHYGRGVIALWHDEVFFVAYAFGRFRGHTLASHGDFGEVITRMLQLCNFEVFRGGSSSGRSRRAPGVVGDMIEHMNRHTGVLYGITVDGSRGPAYRMKTGAMRVARACRAPVLVEKTWCRRYFRLRTWDRTIVPLPFNRIVHVYAGPFVPPPDAYDPTSFDSFCQMIQNELLEVTYFARTLIEDPSAPELLENFPVGWTQRTPRPPLRLPFREVLVDSPRAD